MGLRTGNPEIAAYIERLRTRQQNPLKWPQAAIAAGNKYLRLVHASASRASRTTDHG